MPWETDDRGMLPAFDEGQQVHAGVAEIDMQEVGRAALQCFDDDLQLTAVMHGREAADVFEPKALQEIFAGAGRISMSGKG